MSVIKPIRAGSQAFVRTEVRDESQDTRPLFDPDGGVTLTLRDPNGVKVLDNTSMAKVAVGVYTHFFTTNAGGPYGVWRVEYRAVHGGAPSFSLPQDAFVLVPA